MRMDVAIEYLLGRLAKDTPTESFSGLLLQLAWLMDDQGADIHRIMRSWLDADQIEKVKVALAIDEVFLLESDAEYQASINQIVNRWPELEPMCRKFYQRWDGSKRGIPLPNRRKAAPVRSLTDWLPILAIYQHPEMEKAKDAFWAAGSASLPYLLPLIDDGTTWAASEACELVGILGDPAAIPVLRKALGRDSNIDGLDVEILGALEQLHDCGGPWIYPMLNDPSPKRRGFACQYIEITQDHNATPLIIALLEDPNPNVRRFAVRTLAKIKDGKPSAVIDPLLYKLAMGHESSIRLTILRLFMKYCDPLYIPFFITALRDPYYLCRIVAIDSLKEVDLSNLGRYLDSMSNESNSDVQRTIKAWHAFLNRQ